MTARTRYGTTAQRPTASVANTGELYFDSTLGALVRSNGTVWAVVSVADASITSAKIDSTVAKSVDVQTFTSSGTWTRPAGAKLVGYVVVAGGGGGGGQAAANFSAWGSDGVESSIGSVVTAKGGNGAGQLTLLNMNSVANVFQMPGGHGNVTPVVNMLVPGAGGMGGTGSELAMDGGTSIVGAKGGPRGDGFSGGGGGGGSYGPGGAGKMTTGGAGNGTAAAENTGGGGGGASRASSSGCPGGGGGQAVVGTKPASAFGASETITVGAGGAGGDSTNDGGAGGSGLVIVTTYF